MLCAKCQQENPAGAQVLRRVRIEARHTPTCPRLRKTPHPPRPELLLGSAARDSQLARPPPPPTAARTVISPDTSPREF